MTSAKPRLGFGLVGSGFMGRVHAQAFRSVGGIFDLPVERSLEVLADIDADTAAAAAAALGFRRATDDWKALVADPTVDVVAIAAPNALHKPIALAVIAAGKTVYCEKPLAPSAAEAKEMAVAAEAAGVTNLVGFNYLKNPMTALAREIVEDGEIGEVVSFRGVHAEDYMADPEAPWTWRCDPAGGGVTADLGSHIISMARHLVGPIESVSAQTATIHKTRPAGPGSPERRAVEVDDQSDMLVRFAGGATGTISASWLAAGRKMQLACEIVGTRGSLAFNQERLNELRLYRAGQSKGREGFTTICAGPDHRDYANFCPAPGHQIGFNDLKTIEVRDLIAAHCGKTSAYPDFREALRVQEVVDAALLSAKTGEWVRLTS